MGTDSVEVQILPFSIKKEGMPGATVSNVITQSCIDVRHPRRLCCVNFGTVTLISPFVVLNVNFEEYKLSSTFCNIGVKS